MPALTQDDVIVIDNYNSIKLDEYNGKYSLCAVDNGQNETYYIKWSYPKVWKNGASEPGEKMFPVKVVIGGDKKQAIMTLEKLLNKLGCDVEIKNKTFEPNMPEVNEDQIPF